LSGLPPTVGLALIVRDEEDSIARCLASFWDHVDVVAVLDTGSKDKTVDVVQAFARERGEEDKLRLGHFDWCDDFSAARIAADALLDGCDFCAWIDADDELVGAQNLRALAAQAPADLAAYVADYDYARDGHGNCVCTLRRERLVRRGAGAWYGRVHEAQLLTGPTTLVDPSVCLWVHRKSHEAKPSQPRNLRILRKWLKQEPQNPRVLGYLGTEEAAMGRHKLAVGYYRRYLRLKTGWDQERAQIHRKLCLSLNALGQHHKARTVAYEALSLLPAWPDSYLSLAQCAYALGEHAQAAQWAQRVLELGQPDSLLILNPLDYTLHPRLVLAGACGALGDVEAAIEHASAALAIVPSLPDLQAHLAGWKSVSKREYTARTVVGYAQSLVAHDEQLPALRFLEECVPHFAKDHPDVVAMRSQLRERVYPLLDASGTAEHYEEATEIGIPDLQVAASLPRARLLRDGVLEQLAERGQA
jgi:tetratricopeptide (TPR) repeat protein